MGKNVPKNRLWTPIANSLEVYRRRLIADEKAIYEHVWRLIHIEEALVVTLGSALCTRLLSVWKGRQHQTADLNKLRALVVGMAPPGNGARSVSKWCLSGSIDSWIDLLQRYGTADYSAVSPFIEALSTYLFEEVDGEIAFVPTWQKIAHVPETIYGARNATRVQRIRAINQFRNKLAHVPISHKLLPELHRGIRIELLRLLSADLDILTERHTDDVTTWDWCHALTGRLRTRSGYVSGSDFGQLPELDEVENNQTWFEWIDRDSNDHRWRGDPFVRVDDELKVVLLFRLDGLPDDSTQDQYTGEYHRFAAEVQPTQKCPVVKEQIEDWFPTASPEEQLDKVRETIEAKISSSKEAEASKSGLTPSELKTRADQAFVDRNYKAAYEYFEELAKRNDVRRYNEVARMKHGEAAREIAQAGDIDKPRQIDLLRQSIDLLDRATKHIDHQQSAKAFFLQSKAYWALSRLQSSREHLDTAKTLAERAATIAYESSYVSWYERLEREFDELNSGEVSS
jgi:hypothetical protein